MSRICTISLCFFCALLLEIPVSIKSDWSISRDVPADIDLLTIILSINITILNRDGLVYTKSVNAQRVLLNGKNWESGQTVSGPLIAVRNRASDGLSFDHTACTRVESPVPSPGRQPWVALVTPGGGCSLNTKLYNIFNNTNPVSTTPLMEGSSNVSAVILLGRGKILTAEDYSPEYHNRVILWLPVEVAPDVTFLFNSSLSGAATIRIVITNSQRSGFLYRDSILFVSISFILLMIISFAWLVFYYVQRFRYIHAKERLTRRLANAAKKALSKIPERQLIFGDPELDSENVICAICIESYLAGDSIRVLPCSHIFHNNCVDPWLLEQRTCPICKMDILKAFDLHIETVEVSEDATTIALMSTVSRDPESGAFTSHPTHQAITREPVVVSDSSHSSLRVCCPVGRLVRNTRFPPFYNRNGSSANNPVL